MTRNTKFKTLRNSNYQLWRGLCKNKVHDKFFTPPQILKQLSLNECEKNHNSKILIMDVSWNTHAK